MRLNQQPYRYTPSLQGTFQTQIILTIDTIAKITVHLQKYNNQIDNQDRNCTLYF